MKKKLYLQAMDICIEIAVGCLRMDSDWGSTEIFPPVFINGVGEMYVVALKKVKITKKEKEDILKKVKKLKNFDDYLFDQEGLYPSEAEEILKYKSV